MLQAIELIREGQPFSQALKQFQLTTPVCERLILAGERSGQMAEMMNRAADFLDFELEQTLDRTVKLMEPVLMVVIGGIIGAIVILMYLPIFELADSLQ
jgi:general secretion pathway protein F